MSEDDHELFLPDEYSKLKDKLNCPICLGIFTKPTSLTVCGHSFCEQCIKNSITCKRECPVCKTNINLRSIYVRDSYYIKSIMDDFLHVRCRLGECGWSGKLLDYNIHKKAPVLCIVHI